MGRAITHDEARDEKVAELTDQNFEARRALLLTGDPRTVGDVASSVAAEFNDDSLLDELVQLAVRDEQAAGARFAKLVKKVLLADAETDALRDVEQLEGKGRTLSERVAAALDGEVR